MATQIEDITQVGETSALGTMAMYQKQQMDRQGELDEAMLVYAGLAILQMLAYWKKMDEHVDDRDCAIGEYDRKDKGMLGFLAELEYYRDKDDLGILNEKLGIKDKITAALNQKPNSCETAMLYVDKLEHDGEMLDKFEESFAACSCAGVPDGWGMHDGSLAYGLGAAYAGPLMNIAAVELYETMKSHAVSIVQQAQASIKAIYNISGIMKYYEQVIGIHEGLATMYIQGFNSAGAMLGTALGKLAESAQGSNNVVHITETAKHSPTPEG